MTIGALELDLATWGNNSTLWFWEMKPHYFYKFSYLKITIVYSIGSAKPIHMHKTSKLGKIWFEKVS